MNPVIRITLPFEPDKDGKYTTAQESKFATLRNDILKIQALDPTAEIKIHNCRHDTGEQCDPWQTVTAETVLSKPDVEEEQIKEV